MASHWGQKCPLSSVAWKLVCEFNKLCTMSINKGVMSALHTMHRHLYWSWLVSPSFFLFGDFENRLLAKKNTGFSARVRLISSQASLRAIHWAPNVFITTRIPKLWCWGELFSQLIDLSDILRELCQVSEQVLWGTIHSGQTALKGQPIRYRHPFPHGQVTSWAGVFESRLTLTQG